MIAFIKIGFLEIRFLDILDILLVGLLIFQLYKLVRGSLAFNIFVGLFFVYLSSLLVRALNMHLLSGILGQFIDVGVILLLIVFQPEIRRFLVFVGRGNIWKKGSVWKKFLTKKMSIHGNYEEILAETEIALNNLASTKTGALIVFSQGSELRHHTNTGVEIEGVVSGKMLESIFNKNSPLHDGAVIISEGKIIAANCVLPISDNPNLPERVGLRHRAAVGISEISDALAIVVSEERGELAYAIQGQLKTTVKITDMMNKLKQYLQNTLKEFQ